MNPKVSIVVPVFNVETYLAECLDSLINQTLTDIEIIVVNDGSTDKSLAIAQQYAKKDSRIRVIDKPNAGYGHTMNLGFKESTGKYIGIVESDDYARPSMFEKLYDQATRNNADVVRSNYFTMADNGSVFNLIDVLSLSGAPYYSSFDPQDYPGILRGSPAIWTCLYKNDFIRNNRIDFLESAGASYQDTGFFLKVLCAAKRMVLIREAYLNYRVDNAFSSVKSGAKVFCVSDEYHSVDQFLQERPALSDAFSKQLVAKKYETYLWNFNRLDSSLKQDFLNLMTEEFATAEQAGTLDNKLFDEVEWSELQQIIHAPAGCINKTLSVVPPSLDEREHQKSLLANKQITTLHYAMWCLKHLL